MLVSYLNSVGYMSQSRVKKGSMGRCATSFLDRAAVAPGVDLGKKRPLAAHRAPRWPFPVSLKRVDRCKSLGEMRLYLKMASGSPSLPTFFPKFTSEVATFRQVTIIFAFNESAGLGRYGANHVRGPSLVGLDDSGRVDELGRRAQCRPACPSDRRFFA